MLATETWEQKAQEKFLTTQQAIMRQVAFCREQGKRIATTNGAFDLLHAGHLALLYQASLQGNSLFVLINSDHSIQTYKSPSLPIIPLAERMEMLAALSFVDFVIPFSESTPSSTLELIGTDVHVKGKESQYHAMEEERAVIEQQGGRIVWIDRIRSLATSRIIQRIRTSSLS